MLRRRLLLSAFSSGCRCHRIVLFGLRITRRAAYAIRLGLGKVRVPSVVLVWLLLNICETMEAPVNGWHTFPAVFADNLVFMTRDAFSEETEHVRASEKVMRLLMPKLHTKSHSNPEIIEKMQERAQRAKGEIQLSFVTSSSYANNKSAYHVLLLHYYYSIYYYFEHSGTHPIPIYALDTQEKQSHRK